MPPTINARKMLLADIAMISRPLRRSLGLAATMLVLGGCDDTAVVSNYYYDTSFSPTEYRGVGALPVVVRGNPFAVPQDELDAAVTDAMQGTTFGTVTYFISVPDATSAYRVIMMFNSPVGGDALCYRPGPPNAVFGMPPAERVPLSAALCRGDRSISYANGSIATAGGPQGSNFRNGVRRFALTLFPPVNPENRGGADNFTN